jgi:hypothetical protein
VRLVAREAARHELGDARFDVKPQLLVDLGVGQVAPPYRKPECAANSGADGE